MNIISAWCNHHAFARPLRRRVRRYFKSYFSEKSALDEQAIMSDLSVELRHEISDILIHPFVRNHFMFAGLPPPVMARLVHILQRCNYPPRAKVVEAGQYGIAMFILVKGKSQ